MCEGWNSIEGKKSSAAFLWKHYVTAKVFSIGTQTCAFRTKVSQHAL
jgi:hypothetical protein